MASNPWGILAEARASQPNLGQMYQAAQQNRLEQMYRQRQMEYQDKQMARQDKQDQRADTEYDRGEKVRAGLVGAYDSTTGKLDPVKARGAYLGVGDVTGAINFDEHLAKQSSEQIKAALDKVAATAQVFAGAHDEPSFAYARQQAAKLGVPLDTVPEHYDPNWQANTEAQSLGVKERLAHELQMRTEAETERSHRANEGIAGGNLSLSRQREARVTKWGPQPLIGVVGGHGDGADLDAKYGGGE